MSVNASHAETRRLRVVVTRKLPDTVEAALQAKFDAVLNADDIKMDQAALHDAFQHADAVLCTVGDNINAEVIGDKPRARMLANFAVGYNHIDIDACRAASVAVSNTPGVLTDATADIALTLMLGIMRRASEGERMVRSGGWTGWTPTQLMGRDLRGKLLGIVGMGRIGQATAERARAFGMDIIYHARSPKDLPFPAERAKNLADLMARADVVSLHCPGGEANRGLINAEMLSLMKPSAYLINTARGDVVDEAALIDVLQKGRIAGAGLDVFEAEPNVPQAFWSLDNVMLLPHLGSATLETREAMGMKAYDNLVAWAENRTLPDPVM